MVVYDKQVRRQKRRRGLLKTVFTIGQSFSVGCSMGYYYINSDASSTMFWMTMRFFLLLVCIVAYFFWFLARYQLGQALTFMPSTNGPLIKSGVYAKFKNPIYIFGTICLTSYLLLINKPIYLLALIVIIPLQAIRASREAHVLRKKYDEEYDLYLQHVWI